MTNEQIEEKIIEARRADGLYDGAFIIEMNRKGIWFQFMKEGVRWSRKPFSL